jgi:predicted nuclease with TOPRIM domain
LADLTAEKERLKQQLVAEKKDMERLQKKNRELKDANERLTDRVREFRSEVSLLRRKAQEESKADHGPDDDPELDRLRQIEMAEIMREQQRRREQRDMIMMMMNMQAM